MTEAPKSLYRGKNPADVPLYSFADVVRYLRGGAGDIPNVPFFSFRDLVTMFLTNPDSLIHKCRVEFDGEDPVRLYPFSRPKIDADSPRIVAIDPRYSFGNPIIANRNIRTDVVAGRFRAGESVMELAEDLDVPMNEVEEAIRYEFGHYHGKTVKLASSFSPQ